MLFFFFRKGPGDERGVQTPALAPARARAGAWDCDGHDGRDTRKDKGEAKSTGQLRQARRAAHGTASPRALAGLGQTANSFPCESGCPVRDCARGAPHFFPRRLSGDKDPQPGCRRGGGDAWRLYGHHASFFFYRHRTARMPPHGAIACIRRGCGRSRPRLCYEDGTPRTHAPRPTICAQAKARSARLDRRAHALAPRPGGFAPQAAARRATQTCAPRASARAHPNMSTTKHAGPSTEHGYDQTRYPPRTDFVPTPNI